MEFGKKTDVLRRPAVWLLLLMELLLLASAILSAAQATTEYRFTAEEWEPIAQDSVIGYDEEGRRGVTEMSNGEPILQTPAMSLPAGHYRITIDYYYEPNMTKEGVRHRSTLYFVSEQKLAVTGERAWIDVSAQHDTVVLNVANPSDTIRLVADNDGGIFTVGTVEIKQDAVYAWFCVACWLMLFVAVDLVLFWLLARKGKNRDKALRYGCIAVLAGTVALVCAPLFVSGGGMNGDDWLYHLSRIENIAQSLQQGQFPVRIYSQAKGGYGYAPSQFYGELFLYFPAVLRLFGVSLQAAYRAYVIAVQAVAAGISFFSFRQIFKHDKTALLGSVLYLLAPYHLYNIYCRSAVGEYTAYAFLPLIPAALSLLYGAQQPDRAQGKKACIELFFAFGALVQTHILTMEMAFLGTAIFCVCHLKRTFSKSVLRTWILAVAWVILLNLWFLVPFVGAMLGGYSRMYGVGDFNSGLAIQDQGLQPGELLLQTEAGISVGIVLLVGAAAFLWCWLTGEGKPTPKESKIGLWSVGLGVLACWMATDTFPWCYVGTLPVIGRFLLAVQFPWRYLSPASLLLVLGTICAVSVLRRTRGAQVWSVLLLSAALLSTVTFYQNGLREGQTGYIGDRAQLVYGCNHYSNVAWYFDDLYLPDGAIETRDGFETEAGATTVEISSMEREDNGMVLQCKVPTGQTGYVELPLLYYPGYTVTQGEGQVFRTANGMVGVEIPDGYDGKIRVAFREAKRWLAADAITVLACIAFVAYVCGYPRRKKKNV